MKPGDIFFWNTDQAKGYVARDKCHVYIGPGTWPYADQIFLFISKSNAHGDGYRITKPPYNFLTYEESYVSCGSIVVYDDNDLAAVPKECLATLSIEHIRQLRSAVSSSDFMAADQALLICKLLDRHLSLSRGRR